MIGAVGRRRLPPEQIRDRGRLEQADLHVDIGARDRAEAEALARVGDPGVWTGPPVELPGGRLLSRALDNRLGAYIVLEAAKRIAESGGAAVEVVAVAAVQEEIGLYGARTAAYGLDPLAAIVVDVTPATDTPGGEPRLTGRIDLGAGTMIARGPTLNRKLSDLLADVAAADQIPHAFEVYSTSTSTDADEVHRSLRRADRRLLDQRGTSTARTTGRLSRRRVGNSPDRRDQPSRQQHHLPALLRGVAQRHHQRSTHASAAQGRLAGPRRPSSARS